MPQVHGDTQGNARATDASFQKTRNNGVELGDPVEVEVANGQWDASLDANTRQDHYVATFTGPGGTTTEYLFVNDKGHLEYLEAQPTADDTFADLGDISNEGVEIAVVREGSGSFQVFAGDLELDPDAGTSDSGDTDFLAGVMGNVIGEDLTKTHNYIAGVIGENSVTGTNATELPNTAVLGIVADGVTEVDGIVTALIDGSDPGSTTTANAAFAARQLNTETGSGVDYGLDLHDDPPDIFTDPALPLDIKKADLRLTGEICFFSGPTAPVDGTTGDNFAGKGSIYVAQDTGQPYSNTGTKAAPVWQALTLTP